MDAASLQDADAGSLLRREPPLPLPVGERKGAGEKVWWHTPPSSPAAWERKGAGGKVRAARTPFRSRAAGLAVASTSVSEIR